MEELCKAFGQAKHQPTAIIAKTFKGRGISGLSAHPASLTPPLGPGPVASGGSRAFHRWGWSLRSCVWGSTDPLPPYTACTCLGKGGQAMLCSEK